MRAGALELIFSVPLERASAVDPDNYDLQQWNYRWTETYGSDLYSVADPHKTVGKKGELKGEPLEISAITLSPDGKTITLTTPHLRPVMQLVTRARLKSATGHELPLELAQTIHALPAH